MTKLLMPMLALALLTSCSSEPTKSEAPPPPKPPEALTGRSAFQKLYVSAHAWGQDAKPYRLESVPNSDSNGRDGKSALWHAGFASVVQRGTKPYQWSGSPGPDRGVNAGVEDTYNPNNASTQTFDIAFLKIDSDKAFDIAQQHGGDKLLQQSPDIPVIYVLEWNHVTNELIWHVIYGSRDVAKLKVAVSATSGEFLRIEKS